MFLQLMKSREDSLNIIGSMFSNFIFRFITKILGINDKFMLFYVTRGRVSTQS